jgi:hypothetical protein
MIYYLVTREHAYTIGNFVRGWGNALAGKLLIGPYDGLLAGAELPAGGIYLFTDFDRLGDAELDALARVHASLVQREGAARVLNDPRRSLGRFELLRLLHANGINRFAVYGPGQAPGRLPVLLRPERGFLNVAPELRREAATPGAGEIAVEFCDTADAGGVYRKYGAFVVGEHIVPRHVFFSRNWMVKTDDLLDPAYLDEEMAYVSSNPHAAALLEVCRIGQVKWGRIDYSLLEGRVQVWEINTNPVFASPGPAMPSPRDPVHRLAAKNLVDAMLALA